MANSQKGNQDLSPTNQWKWYPPTIVMNLEADSPPEPQVRSTALPLLDSNLMILTCKTSTELLPTETQDNKRVAGNTLGLKVNKF